ncbi:MAG: hypothetical protein E6J07_10080 [Chloroflexi bacterium]|nr:MAG: hypothetical protein E6J07_10080 [Chloroflexota bacterium]
MAQFVAGLSVRWPDLDSLGQSEVDASPWSGGFDVSPAHVLLTMRFSAPDAVVDFCLATALKLGLNVFDPQDGTLYSPGEKPRKAKARPQKTLICEHCGKIIEAGTPYAESPNVLHMAPHATLLIANGLMRSVKDAEAAEFHPRDGDAERDE